LLWQDRSPITDGIFFKSVVLDAPDDMAAIAVAQQLVDGHDVELWQLDRKIAKFEHKQASRCAELSDTGAEAIDRVKQAGMDAADAAREKVKSPS
jgi:hypothetical protein